MTESIARAEHLYDPTLVVELSEVAPCVLRTPTGELYQVSWDGVTERMVVVLADVLDKRTHSGSLNMMPRSANAIELKPRRRDD
jgi:hypothetical protein